MTKIDYIIKSFSNEEEAQNFSNGNMRLKTQNSYSHSANIQTYGEEFSCVEKDETRHLVNDAFLLCAHFPSYDWKSPDNKGKTFVKINDPCAVFREIETILKPILLNRPPLFGQVVYYDGNLEKARNVDPVTYFCSAESYIPKTIETAFCKAIKHQKEQEVRMVYFLNEEKISLELDKYELSFKCYHEVVAKCLKKDKYELKKIEKCLPFDEWEKEKANSHRGEFYYDYGLNYWREIKFEINPKWFEILK